MVKAKNTREHRITCAYHPQADGVIETPNLGNIRAVVGPCAYQLDTGEMIEI